MDMFSQPRFRNRLLRSLSPEDLDRLTPHLEHRLLPMAAILEEPGRDVDTAIFFESGIGSRIVIGSNNRRAESGHIGREGMSGRAVVLGTGVASTQIRMQVPGEGFAVGAAELLAAMEASLTLRAMMYLRLRQRGSGCPHALGGDRLHGRAASGALASNVSRPH